MGRPWNGTQAAAKADIGRRPQGSTQNGGHTMSKRKPHNLKARIDRSCRALLATNHVAVVNIDPSGHQGMINLQVTEEHCSREDWPGRVWHPAPLDDLPQRSLY